MFTEVEKTHEKVSDGRVPALSSSQLNSNTNTLSPEKPETRCQNSDVLSMGQLGAAVDDVRSSQGRQGEWDEPIGKRTSDAPKVGGNETTGDLAFDHISDSRMFIKNFRQKFMVPEDVKHDFSINEAIRRMCLNSCVCG